MIGRVTKAWLPLYQEQLSDEGRTVTDDTRRSFSGYGAAVRGESGE